MVIVGEVAWAVKGTAAPDRINLHRNCLSQWVRPPVNENEKLYSLLSEPKSRLGPIHKVALRTYQQLLQWVYVGGKGGKGGRGGAR